MLPMPSQLYVLGVLWRAEISRWPTTMGSLRFFTCHDHPQNNLGLLCQGTAFLTGYTSPTTTQWLPLETPPITFVPHCQEGKDSPGFLHRLLPHTIMPKVHLLNVKCIHSLFHHLHRFIHYPTSPCSSDSPTFLFIIFLHNHAHLPTTTCSL
jgi:hypothetical protein